MRIGDRVKLELNSFGGQFTPDYIEFLRKYFNSQVGTIVEIKDYNIILHGHGNKKELTMGVMWDNDKLNAARKEFYESNLIIIKNNKNITMKITNLVKKILDEDTRKLVKAEFLNGDLALTEEGTAELLGIIFLEKKSELVKIAEEKVNDEKIDR